MNPYKLKDKSDNRCGLLALAAVLEMPVDEVNKIGWHGKFYGNDDDSFLHHKQAVSNLGFGFKRRTVHELISGICAADKTLFMMLADDSNPVSYHWFIYHAKTDKYVWAWDGYKDVPVGILPERILSGWGVFSAAYEIVPQISTYKPNILQRLWLWLTGLMKFKLWG